MLSYSGYGGEKLIADMLGIIFSESFLLFGAVCCDKW